MKTFVKICGTTSPADAILARDAGADFLGLILHEPSPRFVSRPQLAEIARTVPKLPLVLVSVNQSFGELMAQWRAFHPRALQLHGDESPQLVAELVAEKAIVWKVLSGNQKTIWENAKRFHDAGAEALVIDARETDESGTIYGGTGKLSDWNTARDLVNANFRVILAGGLSPKNVARAVEGVRPWAVDVVSGVEARKGTKDAGKVRDFVRAVRLDL